MKSTDHVFQKGSGKTKGSKAIFIIMNMARCNIILDLKLHYKARGTNKAMYRHKTEMSNNGPALKNPEVNPHNYLYLVCFSGIRTKYCIVNKKGLKKHRLSTCKRMELDSYLSPCKTTIPNIL